MDLPATPAIPATQRLSPEREKILRDKAQQLETQFLSEMLSYTGLNETSEFSGGIGEDQFSSFLRDAQARAMVDKGGIGLAETIFNSLARRDESGN